ncbi:MAG TPA: polyprenyl synthetase family protein [Saprospiraceae bacterium]|nr:polyprenyl synthetase family protein [Saprospiraceae bacterium]HRV83683.1 polyprenyl synthetase family protein [Saprospiraceae bacterium]
MLPYFEEFRKQFDPFLEKQFSENLPVTLYEPVQYLMKLGGKRLRPYSLWLAAYCYDNSKSAMAVQAAYALELFHAFTLVHDDIMDEAPLRRGKPTVHAAFNMNKAILSGDAMMVHCMDYLLNGYSDALALGLSRELAKTAIGVCQGQQLDMDFAERQEVSLSEYIQMIEAKTAILLGSAFRMGAMIGGANSTDQESLYIYGKETGIAFQIQDDFLDAFGGDAFGKQEGGDILQNKKTFLYLKGIELCPPDQLPGYLKAYNRTVSNEEEAKEKIAEIKSLWTEWGVGEATVAYLRLLEKSAHGALDQINLPAETSSFIRELGDALVWRLT